MIGNKHKGGVWAAVILGAACALVSLSSAG